MRQIAIQLPGHPQPFIDLESPVDIRVIDEALPSDGGAGFLEIGPHDDEEVCPGGHFCAEESGIFESEGGGVDGTGADDDEDAVVGAGEDAGSAVASGGDCLL